MMRKKPPTKIKWIDEEGRTLYAGGIIFTDTLDGDEGIWTIIERDSSGYVHTDIGGRYDFNDGDIYATIARELREELYNCVELKYSTIKSLPKESRIYTFGHQDRPVYLCMIVSASAMGLKDILPNINIKKAREDIIIHNPDIPENWYRTIDIHFLPFKNIKNKSCAISRRLAEIISESFLSTKIRSM